MTSHDTIFAVASGQGRSGICVLRLSGSAVQAVLAAIAGGAPPARRLSLRRLVRPETGEVLDQGLVAFFPAPHSFTGEDQAELHIHGSAAVRAAVIGVLAAQPNCRPAEPGEFTRRAFLNGRMDLTAVEGLADLIDAETEAQRRQALRQLEGGLGRRAESWRDQLIGALAHLEASLDFSDEDDVPLDLAPLISEAIAAVLDELTPALADAARGERLREGFHVVLAGPPNAGKSTLLNAIAQRDAAIVSPIPGTTRDSIEVRCDLGGIPVTLVDTAGLRDSDDIIEIEGVRRSRQQIERADLILWLSPVDAPELPRLHSAGDIVVIHSKSDLVDSLPEQTSIILSALDPASLVGLLTFIEERARSSLGAGDAIVTRQRQRILLEQVVDHLHRAIPNLDRASFELAAEDVRLALRCLGQISGRVDVDDVLDRIFGAFCIGK